MDLVFGQVSAALGEAHGVATGHFPAFQGRLKHYQRTLKFPPGVNTGRGVAAVYGIGHFLKLGLALELNQFGVSPERAMNLVEAPLLEWSRAFARALGNRRADGPAIFVLFDPLVLQVLGGSGSSYDPAKSSFRHMTDAELADYIAAWPNNGPTRTALINITALTRRLATALAHQSHYKRADILEHMLHWASGLN